MKPNSILTALVATLLPGLGAQAAEVVKANNTTTLNQVGSWVSGGPPGSGDVAVWDATVTSSTNYTMGASLAWAGLKVLTPSLDPTIRPTSGQTLTLGSSGVDMSSVSTRNFTLNPVVVVGSNQTWNISTGRTLNAAALTGSGVTLTKSGGGTLKLTGATTYAGGLTLGAGNLESSNTSGTQILSGAIDGSGSFNKTGAGILTLSGANSGYSGPINLSAGQLNLNHASASGTGTLAISGGVLDNTSGLPLTLANNNPQNWSGDFTFIGSNDLNLGTGAVTMTGNRTVTVNANTLTMGGGIAGTGSLTKTGAGTFALSGNSSFSGATLVTGGTLLVNGNHSSNGQFTLYGGTSATIAGTETLTGGIAQFVVAFTAGSSTANITGTLNLHSISGGDTLIGQNVTGAIGELHILSGGVVDVTGAGFRLGNSGGSAAPSGTLTMDPGSTLTLDTADAGLGFILGNGAAGSAGTVNLNGGTLATGRIIRKGTGTGIFNFNGGTLRSDIASGAFMSGLTAAFVRSGAAIVDVNGYRITISQPLLHDSALGASPDGGLLVKDSFGGGVLTLKGGCTYTGQTTIQAGTLALGAGGSISSSPVIDVQTSGTLDAMAGATIATGQTLQGTGTVMGALSVGAGGTLSPGGTSIGTLTALESLTLAGNSVFQIDKTGAVLTNDAVLGLPQLTYGGTLTVTATGSALTNGDSFKLFDATTYSGSFATINLPALSSGLFWELSTVAVDGTIRVVNSVPIPSFSPVPGRYAGAQSVTIASAAGSTIHYTTDGSDPLTSGTVIDGPSPLAGVVVPANNPSFTIMAYATKSGATASAVATAVYNTVSTSTWILDGVGYWSDSVNWLNSLIADGSGITADFSTLTLTADSAAVLDGPRTIGGLKFGDVGNVYNWLLDGSSSNVLTLDSGANTPVAMVVNRTATITVPLAGSHGMIKDGAGTLVLSGANSLTGDTAINAGTLQLGTGSTNGIFGSGIYPIASGGKLFLNDATAVQSSNGLWTNKIRGAGTLELKSAQGANGGANWGPNTAAAVPFDAGFTGTLLLDNGRFDSSPAGLGNISNIIIKDGAQFLAWSGTYTQPITIAGNGWGEVGYPSALRVAGGSVATWSGAITLSANAGIYSQDANSIFTLTGPISGPYECDFIRNGAIFVTPAVAVQNSYGSTKISSNGGASIVSAGNQYAFSTGGLLMNAGTLALNGFNFSFARLSGTSGEIRNNHSTNPSVITVGSDNSSTTYAGTLANGSTGILALTKTGSGTLSLAGTANSYTGATTINGGVLLVANSSGSATGSGPVAVNPGGTLGGTGTVSGSVTAVGTIAPAAAAAGTLSTGAVTLTGTYACQIEGANCDKLAVTGNLALTGSTLAVSTIAAPTAATYVIATYTGTRTGTFGSVTPGYTVDYATPNQVKLVVSGSGYDTWIGNYGLSGSNAVGTADPDKDGIPNTVEFVLGGNPATVPDQNLLPTIALVTNPGGSVPNGDYFKFSYRRTPASVYLNPDMQFDADLVGTWTAATGAPGAVQVVTPNFHTTPTPADRVDVYVPRVGNEVSGKLFGRLRVIVP